MSKSLPRDPSLYFLQKEAKVILNAHKSGNPSACETLRHHAKYSGQSDREILESAAALQDVQHALALEYGFKDWTRLRNEVNSKPADVNLRRLRDQSKELLEEHIARLSALADRLRQVLPEAEDLSNEALFERPFSMDDARKVIAIENGYADWGTLKTQLDPASTLSQRRATTALPPTHEFFEAVKAHSLDRVRALLAARPSLVNADVAGYASGTPDAWGGESGAREWMTCRAIHHAACGREDLLRLLIEFDADVNALGYDGDQPRPLATHCGRDRGKSPVFCWKQEPTPTSPQAMEPPLC